MGNSIKIIILYKLLYIYITYLLIVALNNTLLATVISLSITEIKQVVQIELKSINLVVYCVILDKLLS